MTNNALEDLKEDIKELLYIKPRGRLFFFLWMLTINFASAIIFEILPEATLLVFFAILPLTTILIIGRCKDLQWKPYIPLIVFTIFFICNGIVAAKGINLNNIETIHIYPRNFQHVILIASLSRPILFIYSLFFIFKKGKCQNKKKTQSE